MPSLALCSAWRSRSAASRAPSACRLAPPSRPRSHRSRRDRDWVLRKLPAEICPRPCPEGRPCRGFQRPEPASCAARPSDASVRGRDYDQWIAALTARARRDSRNARPSSPGCGRRRWARSRDGVERRGQLESGKELFFETVRNVRRRAGAHGIHRRVHALQRRQIRGREGRSTSSIASSALPKAPLRTAATRSWCQAAPGRAVSMRASPTWGDGDGGSGQRGDGEKGPRRRRIPGPSHASDCIRLSIISRVEGIHPAAGPGGWRRRKDPRTGISAHWGVRWT